jgi:hypothetical protein
MRSLLLLLLGLVAQAALPPQRETDLFYSAEIIFDGLVTECHTMELDRGSGFVDRHHVCAVDIGFVEKPDDWMPADGKAYVHFYSVVERPPGWSGPYGQYRWPVKGQRHKFYVVQEPVPDYGKALMEQHNDSARNTWLSLVEPNGVADPSRDPVPEPAIVEAARDEAEL